MRKILLLFLLSGLLSVAKAQILRPVKWSYAARKIDNQNAVVFIKASIDAGWHIYSQNVSDGGPVKTTITFPVSRYYLLNGKTVEPKPMSKFETTFNMEVSYFEREVIFRQKIRLNKQQAIVKGTLEYMACNDKQCLPPENVEFNIPVK